MSLSRREARRAALFMLFQWDVTGKPLGSTYEGEVDEFARETAEAVAERAEELDRRIDEAAEGWTADRLGAPERFLGAHLCARSRATRPRMPLTSFPASSEA